MRRLSFVSRLVLSLCLAAVVGVAVGAAPVAAADPIVHLICIGDSDSNIGVSVGQDADNTMREFQRAFAVAGRPQQLKPTLIKGEKVTATYILEHICKLDVKPQDAVVLLYSGHGCTTANNQRALTFRHDPKHLSTDDLLSALQSKGARLTVLLADACSGYGDGRHVEPSIAPTSPRQVPAGRTIEWRTIECLFLNHSGTVDIQAAEPGYNAHCDRDVPGSFFTNSILSVLTSPHKALVVALDRDGDGAVQWDELLPQIRGHAAETCRAKIRGQRPQQAYARNLGRWTPNQTQMAP